MHSEWVLSVTPEEFREPRFRGLIFANLEVGISKKSGTPEVLLLHHPQTISSGPDLRYHTRTKAINEVILVGRLQKIVDAVAKHAATATELGEVAFTRGYGAFFELKGGPYGGVFFKDWPHQPVCRNPDDLPLVTDALSIIRENGARLRGLDKAERPMRHAIAPVALAVIAISIFVIIVAALK